MPLQRKTLVLVLSIKEPYICQTLVNMHKLHGKVRVYGACGSDGGTIGMFHFRARANSRRISSIRSWRVCSEQPRWQKHGDLHQQLGVLTTSGIYCGMQHPVTAESNTYMHVSLTHTFTPTIKPAESTLMTQHSSQAFIADLWYQNIAPPAPEYDTSLENSLVIDWGVSS